MIRCLLMGLLVSSSVPQVAIAAATPSAEWTDGKFSVAGLTGYGIGFDSPNANGFGFGGRGGYTFPDYTFPVQVYTGVSFLYYVGSSQNVPLLGSRTIHIWTLMAEFGYEFVAGPVEVRPFLGLGIGVFGGGFGAFSSSTAYFGLTPGAVATYSFHGPLSTGPFVGADLHITWLPSPDAAIANDLSLLATSGYRF